VNLGGPIAQVFRADAGTWMPHRFAGSVPHPERPAKAVATARGHRATLIVRGKYLTVQYPNGKMKGYRSVQYQREDPMRFRATIELSGKTATGIQVPAEVVEGLGKSRRPAVSVAFKGYTYRTTVAPMGGRFMLPVSAEVREGAGVAAGDQVDVDIELDTRPREVVAPPDLLEALDGDADARRFFDGLSYSNKQRFVLPIEEAKSPETRQRRVARAVGMLREGRS